MKMFTRRMALLVCVLVTAGIFLVGCGGGGSGGGASTATTPDTTSAPASTPDAGGDTGDDAGGDGGAVEKKDHIVYEVHASPNVLDPSGSPTVVEWLINANIYDNLFKAIQQDWSRCEPWLVESYEISNDNKDWTLTIREGIKFHNGDDLTVDDVVFSLERQRKGAVSAAGLVSVNSVEKIDERSLIIRQDYPYPILIETLAGPQFGVSSKAVYEEHGENAREGIIGTGPYKLADWAADNSITLEYFDGYWNDEPQIKSVTFRPILDANASTIAFDSGELDVFSRNVKVSDYERYRADPNVQVTEVTQTSTRGLSMNNSHEKFSDVRVRRAMNHAMDKAAINLLAAEGQYNPDIWVKTDNRGEGYAKAEAEGKIVKYEYDPDKAKALLAEVGYDENNKLQFEIVCSTMGAMVSLAQAMQDFLAQVNTEAGVESVELAQYMQKITSGDFEAAACQWGFEYYWSPLVYFVHLHSNFYFNYEQTQIARVDELTELGVRTWELEERNEIYAELLNVISDQAIVAPLHQMLGIIASTKGLIVYPDSTNIICPVYWMEWAE